MIKSYTIQLPVSVFSVLRKEPDEFITEMKYAAAVKWYELGEISQSKGAEMTGLSRYEFISLLRNWKSLTQWLKYDSILIFNSYQLKPMSYLFPIPYTV